MTPAIYIGAGAVALGLIWLMRQISKELRDEGYRTNQGRFIRLPRHPSHRRRGW